MLTTRPCPVARCNSTVADDRNVCGACAADLERHLAELPARAIGLERAMARLGNGLTGTGGGNEPRLPFDPRLSEAAGYIRVVLVGWIRDLEDDPARHPADTIPAMALWLGIRLPRLLAHPAAADICAEFDHATTAALRAIDCSPERVFLGACECSTELWSATDREYIRCRNCGTAHDIGDLRDGLTSRIAGHLVTGPEFAGYAVRYLGVPVRAQERLEASVRTWASRGRVRAAGHVSRQDGPPQPTYRFGELQEQLAKRDQMRGERSA
jgi:hypothetical protein